MLPARASEKDKKKRATATVTVGGENRVLMHWSHHHRHQVRLHGRGGAENPLSKAPSPTRPGRGCKGKDTQAELELVGKKVGRYVTVGTYAPVSCASRLSSHSSDPEPLSLSPACLLRAPRRNVQLSSLAPSGRRCRAAAAAAAASVVAGPRYCLCQV